jgi:hypothetical protein
MSYLREHGDPLAVARGAAMVEDALPAPKIVSYLEELQGDDGGWPLDLKADQPGGIGETCEILFALMDLRLGEHPMAGKGLAFLLEQQEADGGWQERGTDRQPLPRWQRHGEEAGRLYLTALVSSVLVAYARVEEPAADRALDLLLKHQLEDGTFAGFPRHTTWSALPLMASRLGLRSGPARNIVLTLSREFGEEGWFSSMFAALLRNLLIAGYRMDLPLVRNSWEQLMLRQEEGGFWNSEEGPEGTARSTLDVLWCWKRVISLT